MADLKESSNYKFKHIGGTVLVGVVSVAGAIAAMTGPPPMIPKDTWDSLVFIAILIVTVFKAIQSHSGANEIEVPKSKEAQDA